MDEPIWRSRLRDALATISTVWLILILAGIFARMQPGTAGAILSLAVYIILLSTYAIWSGPGRRTAFPVYLLAGLLYPILTVVLLLGVSDDTLGSLQWLTAGMDLGYQPVPEPHTPVEAFLVPMILNLFGPILIVGGLRVLVGRDRRG